MDSQYRGIVNWFLLVACVSFKPLLRHVNKGEKRTLYAEAVFRLRYSQLAPI